jgi:hypothetical protein
VIPYKGRLVWASNSRKPLQAGVILWLLATNLNAKNYQWKKSLKSNIEKRS